MAYSNSGYQTNYTPSSVIGSSAKEVKIIFCNINDPVPNTALYDAGRYKVTFCIPKKSKALNDIGNAYKLAKEHAFTTAGINIPDAKSSRFFLEDGDKLNAERMASVDKEGNPKQPKTAIDAYKGCYVFTVCSKYQPMLYDANAQFAYATDNAGRQIVVNNHPRYYLSNLEGSYVQMCLKFNVGTGVNGTYAKPYIDWLMQVEPGEASGCSIAPTIPSWKSGAKEQAQAPRTPSPSAPVAPITQIEPVTSDFDDDVELPFEI